MTEESGAFFVLFALACVFAIWWGCAQLYDTSVTERWLALIGALLLFAGAAGFAIAAWLE